MRYVAAPEEAYRSNVKRSGWECLSLASHPHALVVAAVQLQKTKDVVSPRDPSAVPPTCCHYLARYTHRVAISNPRLVARTDDVDLISVEGLSPREPGPYADPGRRRIPPTASATRAAQALRPHPLFGFLAPRCRMQELAQCRQVLAVAPTPATRREAVPTKPRGTWPCPRCGAPMRVVERLTARQLLLEAFLADIV